MTNWRKSQKAIDRKHVGAKNELLACMWLLDQGFEVFRNVSAHGVIDIVGIKEGKTFLFDVKAAPHRSASYSTWLKPEQIAAGVLLLRVYPTGECAVDWEPKQFCAEEFICRFCSRPAVRGKPHQIYCSRECGKQHNRATRNPEKDQAYMPIGLTHANPRASVSSLGRSAL